MNKQLTVIYAAVLSLMITVGVGLSTVRAESSHTDSVCEIDESAWCMTPRTEKVLANLGGATVPKIATPIWMESRDNTARTVSYIVKTKGTITADFAEFKQQANQTLNDARGWPKLGISFREVAEGGDFTLWLAEASTLKSFSAEGCDTTYSCNVGRDVIINQDRWQGATPSWNDAKGSLRDYRHMVVNHETGHWLGHGHRYCAQSGAAAPVMQQQSMDMQGCQPNPWPLSDELYAPNLGIRS